MFAKLVQNTDKTNIIIPIGFDLRQFDYIFSEEQPENPDRPIPIEKYLVQNKNPILPIIPGTEADWNNYDKGGGFH